MTIDPRIAAAVNGVDGEAEKAGTRPCLMNRRSFLLTSGIATTVVIVGIPGLAQSQTPAAVATYPRKSITTLSSLSVDEPFDFEYPDEGAYAESILVKLGKRRAVGSVRRRTWSPLLTPAPTKAGRSRAPIRQPTRRWVHAHCT